MSTFHQKLCMTLATVLVVTIVGCTTIRIQSNKDPNYALKIHRLAAVVNTAGDDYEDSFNSHFAQLLIGCGVDAITLPSSKSKEDAMRVKFPNQKNADAILTIKWTKKQIAAENDYELTLWDPQGKKVWKSLVEFVIGRVIVTDKGELLAYDIVDKMNNDGLFVAPCQLPSAP